MDTRIEEARAAFDNAQAFLAKVVYESVSTCNHPRIIEYAASKQRSSVWPASRVCLECGLCEEGWGSGYHVLNNPQNVVDILSGRMKPQVKTISLSTFDKVRLERRELTLELLLKHKLGL